MKERDPLDEFLRQQLSGRTYDFKESYWEAASALIEANARRRRRRWWGWLGGLGLLLLLTGSLWTLWPERESEALRPLPPLAQQPVLSPTLAQPVPAGPVSPLDPAQPAGLAPQNRARPATSSSLTQPPPTPPLRHPAANHAVPPSPSAPAAAAEAPVAAVSPQARRAVGPIDSLPAWRWPWQQPQLAAASRFDEPLWRGPGRHSLGLTLGAAYNPAWQPGEGGSFHPLGGVHYHLRLNRHLRLQAGLLYQGRSGLGLDSLFQSVDFGFGARVETVLRSPRQLHFLEVPLTLEWRLKNRHYLQAGAYVAGLLDVSGQQSRVLSESLEAPTEQTLRGFGFRQGLQRMDYGLALGYQYYLGGGLRLGASGRYGLRDLSDDTFYQVGRFDRTLQFRLTLSYDLFHF